MTKEAYAALRDSRDRAARDAAAELVDRLRSTRGFPSMEWFDVEHATYELAWNRLTDRQRARRSWLDWVPTDRQRDAARLELVLALADAAECNAN